MWNNVLHSCHHIFLLLDNMFVREASTTFGVPHRKAMVEVSQKYYGKGKISLFHWKLKKGWIHNINFVIQSNSESFSITI